MRRKRAHDKCKSIQIKSLRKLNPNADIDEHPIEKWTEMIQKFVEPPEKPEPKFLQPLKDKLLERFKLQGL